jgi:glycosyltransferase involved in cell wall biosynthesis
MNNPAPELSIIICGKENESELNKTLNSLIGQVNSRYKLDLILSDFKHEYLNEVKFKLSNVNFDLYVSEPNGIYNAMNLGLKVSDTEYVLFLNSGDELYSIESLNKLLDKIAENSWGYGSIIKIYDRKKLPYSFNPYWRFLHRLGIKYVPHPATILNREQSIKFGGYDEKYKVAADQKLIMQFGKLQPPTIIRSPIANFYAGGISSMRTNAEIMDDFRNISSEIYGRFFENKLFEELFWKFLVKIRKILN